MGSYFRLLHHENCGVTEVISFTVSDNNFAIHQLECDRFKIYILKKEVEFNTVVKDEIKYEMVL